MSSRNAILGLAALLAATASCGKFGSKDPRNEAIDYGGGTGCLNEIGPKLESYARGEVGREEWQGVFRCATDSLGQFRKFVRGSDGGNYTRADMKSFIGQFLVTNKPVTEELVASAFELKASLIGGSPEVVTSSELDRFLALMDVISAETGSLLPHLYNRIHSPTQSNLFALAAALENGTGRLALALGSSGTLNFSRATIETLAIEVSKIAGFSPPEAFSYWFLAGKALLLGGTDQHIEASFWGRLIRMAGVYGGLAFAGTSAELSSMTGPNELGEFLMALGRRLHSALAQTLGFHGGALPFARMEKLADKLPASWLPIPATLIKQLLRPVFITVLGSRASSGFDRGALDLVLERAEFWTRGQTHLALIFRNLGTAPEGVALGRFQQEAAAHAGSLTVERDKQEVARLVDLAVRFRPMFREGEDELTFDSGWQGRTLRQLTHLHWIQIATERLLGAYSTHPDRNKGLLADFELILQHWNPLLMHFKKGDPRVPNLAELRFRDANLFMYNSDGNGWVDADEAIYYIGFLLSSGIGSARLADGIAKRCANLGDEFGVPTYDPECFRREYFGERRTYWAGFPQFLAFYEKLGLQDQIMIDKAIEQAGRFGGYSSDRPVSFFDLDGLVGIVHYVEGMFQRFDVNSNGRLNLKETMGAFPVFRRTISEIGKIGYGEKKTLEAAFTYIVKTGTIPDKGNFLDLAEFVAWLAWRPFWSIDADRKSLYKVISMLAVTVPAK